MHQADPIWGFLREQGRYNLVWLARQTTYSHSHVKALAAGIQRPSPRFRAACARVLGVPESALFHDGSSASQPGGTPIDGSDNDRADTVAVASVSAAAGGCP